MTRGASNFIREGCSLFSSLHMIKNKSPQLRSLFATCFNTRLEAELTLLREWLDVCEVCGEDLKSLVYVCPALCPGPVLTPSSLPSALSQ